MSLLNEYKHFQCFIGRIGIQSVVFQYQKMRGMPNPFNFKFYYKMYFPRAGLTLVFQGFMKIAFKVIYLRK